MLHVFVVGRIYMYEVRVETLICFIRLKLSGLVVYVIIYVFFLGALCIFVTHNAI